MVADALTLDDFCRVYIARPRAYSAHLLPGDARHEATAMAVCGRRPQGGDRWRGALRVEQRQAYERPVCHDCLVVARKLTSSTIPRPRAEDDALRQPDWCMTCGRTRICDDEFEWVTALDGWRHRWRYCPEDRRYERASLQIPAIDTDWRRSQ